MSRGSVGPIQRRKATLFVSRSIIGFIEKQQCYVFCTVPKFNSSCRITFYVGDEALHTIGPNLSSPLPLRLKASFINPGELLDFSSHANRVKVFF